MPPTPRQLARPHVALHSAFKTRIRPLSPVCATTSTSCSPASAINPKLTAERRFREVRRRTRPMGTFQDRTSMDRILFAVFIHENKSQGVSTPFLLTQNNRRYPCSRVQQEV